MKKKRIKSIMILVLFAFLIVFIVNFTYLLIGAIIYAFKNPELTITQNILHFFDDPRSMLVTVGAMISYFLLGFIEWKF